ncbi:prephenate dehydratase [Candidatus Gottesmanbacteria bacterium]|nr:prephenate dehydratase [Candidatus Gottesmanbacteria bacterium]
MKKIAYLGIPGSYSYIAAIKYFGKKNNMSANNSITDVFLRVADKTCDFGVVPLENTTTGSITETYDSLIDSGSVIIGEIMLHIHHHLLGVGEKVGQSLNGISTCYSHPQAIDQCQKFFKKHVGIKPVFTSDTATGARMIAQLNSDTNAAIGASHAAKLYGLQIWQKRIEDNPNNFTRFAVIAKATKKKGNKISLVFSVEHRPGSLFRTLEPYARLGLNLTKIESRPVFGKPWEYIFFLDFEIGKRENQLSKLLSEMKEHVNFLKVLGRYNKGKIYET